MSSSFSDSSTRASQSIGSASDEEPLLDLAIVAMMTVRGGEQTGRGGDEERVGRGVARV